MWKIVPVFKVSNMNQALIHYTGVLDFEITDPNDTSDSPVVDLEKEGCAIQLTVVESAQLFGSVVNVWVSDVDQLFIKYIARGLDTSKRVESPVHQGPVDQSWGRREFYVTDVDGNTLRFCQYIDQQS